MGASCATSLRFRPTGRQGSVHSHPGIPRPATGYGTGHPAYVPHREPTRSGVPEGAEPRTFCGRVAGACPGEALDAPPIQSTDLRTRTRLRASSARVRGVCATTARRSRMEHAQLACKVRRRHRRAPRVHRVPPPTDRMHMRAADMPSPRHPWTQHHH